MEQYGGLDGFVIIYIDVVLDERDTYKNEHKKKNFNS